MAHAPTEKLYWTDAFATTCESERVTLSTFEGRPSVVVDATVFYPEHGGQLGDQGWLEWQDARVAVVDTQIDDTGVIHHLLAEPPPALREGTPLRLVVDGRRRASQREQHTAQHMLSRALADEANAPTVSARLGHTSSTIDVGVDRLDDALLARAEDLANAAVRDDLVVRAFFPAPGELQALPLRRAPKVTENVRIVAVGDVSSAFDLTPCGGTHVRRTGEIGAIRVIGAERYKGMTRVTFLVAASALADARTKDRALSALARDLSCGPLDVAGALEKLRAELKVERDLSARLLGEVTALEAARLLAEHPPRSPHTSIVAFVEREDVARARALAAQLVQRDDVLAFVVAGEPHVDAVHVVLARGAAVGVDCGKRLRSIASAHGGKGGGGPARAEGKLAVGATREALVNALAVAEA